MLSVKPMLDHETVLIKVVENFIGILHMNSQELKIADKILTSGIAAVKITIS